MDAGWSSDRARSGDKEIRESAEGRTAEPAAKGSRICQHTTRQTTSATRYIDLHIDFVLAVLEGVLVLVGFAIVAMQLYSKQPLRTGRKHAGER
jgi:hypothetical protein